MTLSSRKRKVLRLALLLLIALELFTIDSVMAQVKITGNVKDDDQEPLPFANVLLIQPQDSSLIMGDITNVDGNFILTVKPDNYLIKISMIGYEPVFSPVIEVSAQQETVHLETFYLSENVKQLGEVVIEAQKPLFEKQIDRTVINVQSSLTSMGSTALEVLEKSPGVVVNRQNNDISMNGKSGVLIMMNDKVSRMPVDAVVQMLDGMNASNIKQIELITSPPAKYDAEGDAGIIHIVTTKGVDMGTNGNFGITLGYNKKETLGANLNVNHREERLNLFLDYAVNRDQNIHKWINERHLPRDGFIQTEKSTSHRNPTTIVQNLRTGLEYDFSKRTKVSFLLTGYMRNWDMDANTENFNAVAPDFTIFTDMYTHEINRWQSATGSLGITHQLNDKQELKLSFDYLYYHNNNPSDYDNKTTFNASSERLEETIRVQKKTPINFKIGKLDYSNQISNKVSIDAGLKGTFSAFDNDVKVERFEQGEPIIDEKFTNISNLDERIFAAYGAWNWNPQQNWTINGGLRYEYTDTYLSTPEEKGIVDRSSGNFFPSLLIARNITEESKIQLAYDRRITRPTFNDMAPFVLFIGPNTFVSGNLSLKPAISDGIDISYHLKQWWVSLQYSYTPNDIARLQPEINANTNEQIFRSQNMKYKHTYAISTALPVYVSSWWEIQNNVAFYFYDYATQHLDQNISRNATNLTANVINNFTLPNDLSLELSGNYQSASLWGITQFEPMGKVNLGIRKQFKSNNGSLTLAFNDIFNTSIWRLKTDVPEANIHSSMKYDWGGRSVNVTYTRRLGNRKVNGVNVKSGSEEEQKRVNLN